MKRLIVAFLLAIILPSAVHATSQSQAELNVYPLDCVFEQINDGSNQVVFLTPTECGQNIFTDLPAELQEQTPISVSIPSDSVIEPGLPADAEALLRIAASFPPIPTMHISWTMVTLGAGMAQLMPLITQAIARSLVRLFRYLLGLIKV